MDLVKLKIKKFDTGKFDLVSKYILVVHKCTKMCEVRVIEAKDV